MRARALPPARGRQGKGRRCHVSAPMLKLSGLQTWLAAPYVCRSGNWPEHPDAGRFSRGSPHRQQQAINFGHKERGPRSSNRWNTCNAPIRAPFRVEDVQETFAATDIDTAAVRIDENIVGIAADFGACNETAVG